MELGVEKVEAVSRFRYLHYQFNPELSRSIPTLVYLHGAGEYGDDIQAVTRYGLPSLIKTSRIVPACDIICPQMELDQQWDAERLHLFLCSLRNAGHDSILAGYSRGGAGVCNYLAHHGSSLSLAIVISGRGLSGIKTSLEGLKILSIMGEDDPWPRMDEFLGEARKKGADVRDVRLQGRSHYISEEVFLSGELPKVLSQHQINFQQS